MITINCPSMQDYVIKTLEEANEGGLSYHLIEKNGMKLLFDVNTDDLDLAVATAKKVIKGSPLGSSLYYQIVK